jgi:hypothetical protein
MAESIAKVQFIVMDGSDERVMDNIIGLVNHITKDLFVEATCRPLDDKHKTMIVVETVMDDETFELVQKLIEKRWPALCVFNPPM